jgi:hypothetical protein
VFTTQTAGGSLHCAPPPDGYYGFAGINGVIGVPSGISGVSKPGHFSAPIGIAFSSSDLSWVQVGWTIGFSGCGSYTITATKPEIYAELIDYAPSGGNCTVGGVPVWYYLFDWGPMTAAASFDVEYAGGGCWNMYSPTHSVHWCGTSGFPSSGQAIAQVEEEYADAATVPTFDFGDSPGNLTLKTYSGWRLWIPYNSSTFPWYSTTYDERYNSDPCMVQSDYANYYRFLSYEKPTC